MIPRVRPDSRKLSPFAIDCDRSECGLVREESGRKPTRPASGAR